MINSGNNLTIKTKGMWEKGDPGPRTLKWDPPKDLRVRHWSSRSQLFFKIGVLKNFAIFTGKHMCWSIFLIIETPTQVFSRQYCKNFKSSFFYRTHLVAASGDQMD